MALVKTTRSSACKSCASKDSCKTGGGGKEMEVTVTNSAKAGEGDRILINIETAPLLKASFLLYVFPILLMIIGAVIGQEIALARGWDPSGLSAIVAFLFFGLSFVIIKVRGAGMSKKQEYRPDIIRILSKG